MFDDIRDLFSQSIIDGSVAILVALTITTVTFLTIPVVTTPIHEFGHVVFLSLSGCEIKEVSIRPFFLWNRLYESEKELGMVITECEYITWVQEFAIKIAGALFEIIFAVGILVLSRKRKYRYLNFLFIQIVGLALLSGLEDFGIGLHPFYGSVVIAILEFICILVLADKIATNLIEEQYEVVCDE